VLSKELYTKLSDGIITGPGLKTLRKAMKLTQSTMARAMGIRPSQLFAWENNPPTNFAPVSKLLISDFVFNAVDRGYLALK
jgi:transcriptional regulator with XRE-family HTH domain